MTTTGPVDDPLAADWTDAMERIRGTDPIATLAPLVDRLPVGGRVLVSCPAFERSELEGLPAFTELESRRCLDARDHLVGRPDLEVEAVIPHPPSSGSPRDTRVLTKVAPAP